jgi:hypothetical protein
MFGSVQPQVLSVTLFGSLELGHDAWRVAATSDRQFRPPCCLGLQGDETHLAPSLYDPVPPRDARTYLVVACSETGLKPAIKVSETIPTVSILADETPIRNAK